MVGKVILSHGTEEQKQQWLPGIATGEILPGKLVLADGEASVRRALAAGSALLVSEQVGVARWCLQTTLAQTTGSAQWGGRRRRAATVRGPCGPVPEESGVLAHRPGPGHTDQTPSASFTSAAVRDERRHGLALQLANSSIRQNRVRIGDHLPASATAR
ncbi:acyl-CoA dehydrogenase family protein [Streptomyces sp. NPDC058293]|uniref:acyl-CoA dehydrogenase family protein n=1 Tax=Streptomyces sp. NPDC058293 TaxID=3346429 RepID=UPI0036E6F88D